MVSHLRLAGAGAQTRRGPMDSQERQVAGVTVRIDRLLCVGFETCIEVAPDLFELDDEGIAVFRAETNGTAHEEVLGSCKSCPVDALEVHDESGTQLVP